MSLLRARIRELTRPPARERGQATVEYVGLAVAVAVLLATLGGGLSSHGGKLGDAVAQRITSVISAEK